MKSMLTFTREPYYFHLLQNQVKKALGNRPVLGYLKIQWDSASIWQRPQYDEEIAIIMEDGNVFLYRHGAYREYDAAFLLKSLENRGFSV